METENTETDFEQQEYETQYFGFTPKSFSDGMFNATVEYTSDWLNAAQQYMKTEFVDLVSNEQFNRASEVMFPKMIEVIDEAFDKFEKYLMKNILHIPNNVILKEDKIQENFNYTQEEEELLDQEILELKSNIAQVKFVNSELSKEIDGLKIAQERYDNFNKKLEGYEKICKDHGISDLHETMKFVLDKASVLKQMMTALPEKDEPSLNKREVEEKVDQKTKKHKLGD